jgi:large subunit ribosomal protein L13
MKRIIDVKDCVLGRFSSEIAKMLLKGDIVEVVNAKDAIIIGHKADILKRYKEKVERGDYRHGPFFPRHPHFIITRTIRGMVDTKKKRGREAIKRLTVHIDMPKNLEKEKKETLDNTHISKSYSHKFMTLGAVSKELGAKWND